MIFSVSTVPYVSWTMVNNNQLLKHGGRPLVVFESRSGESESRVRVLQLCYVLPEYGVIINKDTYSDIHIRTDNRLFVTLRFAALKSTD